MRKIFIVLSAIIFLYACKKDKFTTAPQISYKAIEPNSIQTNIPFQTIPVLTLHITDAEGDVGFKENQDTAFVYLKNLLTGKTDSLKFPNIGTAGKSNFEADVDISLETVIEQSNKLPPKVDTLFFEVYVKDFAKNKSNTITTPDPVYLIVPQ